MAKVWKFYDGMGCEVWDVPYGDGDTEASMWHYWNDLIDGEEYDPGVEEIVLEEV